MLLFDDLAFRWRLRRLLKRQNRIRKLYQPDLARARKEKDREREQSLAGEMFFETDLVENELAKLQHTYLTTQASRLLIPLPEFKLTDGKWRELPHIGGYALTADALFHLAREVRQERRERVELAFLWPSALVGLVGGVAGLVSAFVSWGEALR